MPMGYWLVTLASQIAIVPLIVWWARRYGGATTATTLRIALLLVAWLAGAVILTQAGAFAPHPGAPPTVGIAVVVPIALGVYFLSRPGARAPESSLAVLAALQVVRLVGFEFVVAGRSGWLSTRFGEPAGWGDALIGVTAPWAALAIAHRWRGWRAIATVWNLAGIADLVDAVAFGVLSAAGPQQVFHDVPGTVAMGQLPLSLIPTFGVPLAVLGHFVALRALRAAGRGANRNQDGGDVMKKEQVVLVTGVSSGIGEMTARALVRDGHRVFGTVRSERAAVPEGVERVVLDVRDEASIDAAVKGVLAKAGRIDALVNNAGGTVMGALEETDVSQAQALFDVNFFGAVRVTNAVLPAMRAQREGRVVFVSSVVGFLPAPFMGFYAASKHALEAYAESLDHEVRGLGVRAVLVEPGFMRTKIDANAVEAARHIDDYRATRERVRGAMQKMLEKGDDPALVAEAIVGALREERPKLRKPVGKGARMLAVLRSWMPAGMFERSFRREFQVDGG
jgi:NAD(P)-dependent dehydrogenase (short-subunit alcohol dehydrogenase family)